MEPDEVHAEIERRKKRAKDLKIREVLWSLYNSHFMRYEAWIREDPKLVYPGIKESIKIFAKEVQFSIGRTTYQLTYKEGLIAEGERLRGRDRGEFFEEDIIPATLALRVDDQWVFEFELCRRTRRTQFGPVWDNPPGEVIRFSDGPWVLELTDLLEKIRSHEEGVRNEREDPRKTQELEAL